MKDSAAISSEKQSANLLGVRISTLTLTELMEHLQKTILEKKKSIVANANIHALNISYEVPEFRDFLNKADVVFCDGFGVKWAAELTGMQIPERYTPPDWLPDLCRCSVENDFSLFFLATRQQTIAKAAARIQEQFPPLRIVGVHHGFFDKRPGSPENEAVLQQINAVRPNILLVGFGMPAQEFWIRDNWDRIEANVVLPVGAMFDYLAGDTYRAPQWVTGSGLEWLARFVMEPRRLMRRYMIGNPLFLLRVIRHHILARAGMTGLR